MSSRLELRNLHKRFPGVYAVKGVGFVVEQGEVHALVGENGAGKSTLMKMINGELTLDEGEILYNGIAAKAKSVSDAKKLGVSMIHQELSPLKNMTIAQNIFLGNEMHIGKTAFVDDREMNKECGEILKSYGMNLNPKSYVADLSIAQIQMLEIIKAVRSNANLIIMDEPTSSLSDEESQKLFTIIHELVEKNVSVIYISHRLDEILDLSDQITVLRDGTYVKTVSANGVTKDQLVEMMVGRSLDNIYPKEEAIIGEPVLKVEGLTSEGVFKDIDFIVRSGEILGVSGLVGAGRSEIFRAVFGIDPYSAGKMFIDGQEVNIKTPAEAIDNGLAFVSEDRKELGLVLCRSIKENVALPNLKGMSRLGFIKPKSEKESVESFRDMLSIKAANIGVDSSTLSGGNQQKVVLAKWLLSNPKVLILDEPTRGIDVGAKFEIYKIMSDLAKQGIAIVMISSELPEIIGMSDRVIVISQGMKTGEFMRDKIMDGTVTQKELLNSALHQ